MSFFSQKIVPIYRAILNIVYPAYCLHCHEKIFKGYLCEHCFSLMDFSSIVHKKNNIYYLFLWEIPPFLSLYKNYSHHFFALKKVLTSFLVIALDQMDCLDVNTLVLQKKRLRKTPLEELGQSLSKRLSLKKHDDFTSLKEEEIPLFFVEKVSSKTWELIEKMPQKKICVLVFID